MNIADLKPLAKRAEPSTKKLFEKLKKRKPKELDDVMQNLHDLAFEKVDCMTCANCCKTTSPIFYDRDIERVARRFRMKASEFIDKYLHIDEDKDYVLNSAPCPFLGEDNFCNIYEDRPNACREYPHTDRKRFYQVLDITIKNASVCPAVFNMVEELKKIY